MRAMMALLAAMVAGVVLSGCGGGPREAMGAYNVPVRMDQSWAGQPGGATVQVDIVGVPDGDDMSKWLAKSMTEYWRDGDQTRADAEAYSWRTVLDSQRSIDTLPKTHPIWKTWKEQKRWNLLILASLTGVDDKPGDQDPRRKLIRATTLKYDDGGTISVLVQRSGVIVETPAKPDPVKK